MLRTPFRGKEGRQSGLGCAFAYLAKGQVFWVDFWYRHNRIGSERDGRDLCWLHTSDARWPLRPREWYWIGLPAWATKEYRQWRCYPFGIGGSRWRREEKATHPQCRTRQQDLRQFESNSPSIVSLGLDAGLTQVGLSCWGAWLKMLFWTVALLVGESKLC